MPTLMRLYPGDQLLDVLLVTALAAALLSAIAWLISLKLGNKAALRNCVLLTALVCTLAAPVMVWLCATVGLTLVAMPILGEEPNPRQCLTLQAPSRPVTISPKTESAPAPTFNETSIESVSVPIEHSSHVASEPKASFACPEVQQGSGINSGAITWREVATAAILVWADGMFLLFARLDWNALQVVRFRHAARPVRDECYLRLLRQVVRRQRLSRTPLLLVSSRRVAPLAVGFGPPAIVLPKRVLGAVGERELYDILMHEAAHLARGDQWIVLLERVAGAVYWPVVPIHALARALRQACEELCDNVVLAQRDAIGYGKTLLHVAELLSSARPMAVTVGMFEKPSDLERRIVGLLNARREMATFTSRKATCLIALAFLAAGGALSATRLAVSAEPEAAAPPATAIAPARPAAAAAGHSLLPDADDPTLAARFSGRVTGPDGKPFPNARIHVAALDDNVQAPLPLRAKTDTQGRFEFDASDMTLPDLDGLPARRPCLVIATSGGYGPAWIEARGRSRSTRVVAPRQGVDLELQLVADDVPIQGRLIDSDGRPLADAQVRVTQLMIPRGQDLDRHLEREINSSVFNYPPEYQRFLTRPRLLPELKIETQTDAEGRFILTGLGRDRIAELSVSAPNAVHTSIMVMTRKAPDVRVRLGDGNAVNLPPQVIHGANFTRELQPGLTVRGRVIDRDTREPIAGIWVGASGDLPLDSLTTGKYHRVTDAQGRFTITGLSPRLLELDDERRRVFAVSSPGLTYQTATAVLESDAEVLIECSRGIPFRLKLVDEQGRPVEATVTYVDIRPNPHVRRTLLEAKWPVSRAAQRANGTYEGFVLPGPGAVLVKTPTQAGYRPAYVNPKAFFAPDAMGGRALDQNDYGTENILSTTNAWIDQHDYAAIVLVNPRPGSEPLELSATLVKDRPRQVSLVDAESNPVAGATTDGMTYHPYDHEPPLRAASFPLVGLHPDRVRRIKFLQEDRRLVGFLQARGDSEEPLQVSMQPWATVTGRIIDENGEIFGPGRPGNEAPLKLHADIPGSGELGDYHAIETDLARHFRIERLVPGQTYSAVVYQNFGGAKFPVFENLVLEQGEVRNLGDVRIIRPEKQRL